MNEVTTIRPAEAQPAGDPFRKKGGMTPEEAAYMRGGKDPVAGSVPMSTSRYLNSPLFVHAFTTMSLRRFGPDVTTTYDIPTMSRGLADVADYQDAARLVAEEREKNPDFAAWLDRRHVLALDHDRLAKCAAGTFGAAVHEFVQKGYKLDFVNAGEARSDLEYLMKQIGNSHDLQHIATGYGANHAGEHALNHMNIVSAFNLLSPELARTISMATIFVTSALFTRVSLHYPAAMPIILEAARIGTEAGQSMKTLLFMIDWDDYYDWRLDDLAAHLGFARGPGDEWAYTEDLCTG